MRDLHRSFAFGRLYMRLCAKWRGDDVGAATILGSEHRCEGGDLVPDMLRHRLRLQSGRSTIPHTSFIASCASGNIAAYFTDQWARYGVRCGEWRSGDALEITEDRDTERHKEAQLTNAEGDMMLSSLSVSRRRERPPRCDRTPASGT
jgi:hypothetical protein